MTLHHRDGSYDQAYPHEHSYGATAFLLPDMIAVYKSIKSVCSNVEKSRIEDGFRKSADFLCRRSEQHEFIANHLAGAVLALQQAHALFDEKRYDQKANEILGSILDRQSEEGWFPEYGGADPGYQTLCMYYLAQIYRIDQTKLLKNALEKSLQFLQFFIHPDGTYGGEYGSRRTEIFYPGGIAMLASEFPIAASMRIFMGNSIASGKTVNLIDVDMGNLAPLLSNYIAAHSVGKTEKDGLTLPIGEQNLTRIFKGAGLSAISKPAYYAVLGSSNGGMLKIFNKKSKKIIFDDCGYLGETKSGRKISSQNTNISNSLVWKDDVFRTRSTFSLISDQSPTPFNYLMLRIANLTIMRLRFINEGIKKNLVKLLINRKSQIPLSLSREIEFRENSIHISDKLEKSRQFQISRLASGIKFSSIHMASSRYFTPAQFESNDQREIDIEELQKEGFIKRNIVIDVKNSTEAVPND